MAVTKIWQVKGSLADVVKYAGNPEKTKPNDLARVVGYAADEHKMLDERAILRRDWRQLQCENGA